MDPYCPNGGEVELTNECPQWVASRCLAGSGAPVTAHSGEDPRPASGRAGVLPTEELKRLRKTLEKLM